MAMKIIEKLRARQHGFANTRPVCIAFMGDSVTHGCFEVFMNEQGNIDTVCRAEDAYPAKLTRALGELFPFAQPVCVNAGVSGDNATNGRKRLTRDALSFAPDLVTVNFALNDSMNPDVEGGLKQYEASMRGIFEDVLASGAECMLVTPSPMCAYVSHALTDAKLREIAKEAAKVQNGGVLGRYVDAARRAAVELNVPVADAFARWTERINAGVDATSLLANSINHPNAHAHGIFVEEILRTLMA